MLLRQSPHLRIFEFHTLTHPSRTPLDLSALKSALEHVRTTLTHLTICYEIFADEEYGDPDEQEDITTGTWGSFASYPFLTHLSLSTHAIFSLDDVSDETLSAMLPPGLQCLTITDDLHWLDDVQMCFRSSRFLAMFRSYLVGDKILERYAKDKDDRDVANEKIVSIKGNLEGSG
jgi:hypothetical protein